MKQSIVFSLDQGWGNGPVAARDLAGVRRFARAVKPLQARYDVGAGITPAFAFTNRADAEAVLGALAGEGVPFWIDAISSDVLDMLRPETFAARSSLGCAYDPGHGVCVPVQQIQAWLTRYGAMFAGCRSHETFTNWRTVSCFRSGTLDWAEDFAAYLPGDEYYRLKLAEPFVAAMHAAGRPFVWSEPLWSRSERLWPGVPRPDYSTAADEQQLRDLVNAYPGTVVPAYANNVASAGRQFDYWNDLNESVFSRTSAAAGWGLGAQTWAVSPDGAATPEALAMLTDWVPHALRYQARVVWVEPPWALFRWPGFSFGPTGVPPAPDSGTPTAAFYLLAEALP